MMRWIDGEMERERERRVIYGKGREGERGGERGERER